MKNSKHPQISYLEKSEYSNNLPKVTHYATLNQSAEILYGDSNYFKRLSTEIFDSNTTSPNFYFTITNPISLTQNYTTQVNHLTTVRKGLDHNELNVIFLNKSNSSSLPNIQASVLNINFNQDFITSTQDYTNPDVGSDIWGNIIGEYKIQHNYYVPTATGPTATATSATLSINGFSFFNQLAATNSNTTTPISKITMNNSDPTNIVSNNASINQARYGGYYNYQTILKNNTGVFDINETNISDSADTQYLKNTIVLMQTMTLPSPNISNTKTINYYIGFSSPQNIVYPTTYTLNIPSIITDHYLFGIAMPSQSVTFDLATFVINQIYIKWIWKDLKLCTINLYYRRSGSNTYTINNTDIDWAKPVTNSQTISYSHSEGFSNSSDHFIKDLTDRYSRNGLEASDNNSQFYIEIITTNNIFSQESTDLQFTEKLNSNSTTGPGFNWSLSSEKILWWDYTYKQGSGAILSGELPFGFVTTQLGNNSNNVYLKDPRGAGNTNIGGNNTFWLGGGTTSTGTHDWYENMYDHRHSSSTNPSGLEDNQLLWANGSFRAGDSNLTSTDRNFPYINYQIYYNNNNSSNNYANKKNLGENWNYNISISQTSTNNLITINGTYKFIVIEDSNPRILGSTFYNNAWTDVEVYVNGNSYSDSNTLTLGTDYIMYICLEGPRYNGFGNGATSFNSNSSTKYRTGWLDCQRIKSGFTTVADGAGCGNCKVNNVLTRYRFTLEGLSSAIPANGIVSKIFYRIGIKNGSQKDIKSINIKYVK